MLAMVNPRCESESRVPMMQTTVSLPGFDRFSENIVTMSIMFIRLLLCYISAFRVFWNLSVRMSSLF